MMRLSAHLGAAFVRTFLTAHRIVVPELTKTEDSARASGCSIVLRNAKEIALAHTYSSHATHRYSVRAPVGEQTIHFHLQPNPEKSESLIDIEFGHWQFPRRILPGPYI